jgi:hypothetical protein
MVEPKGFDGPPHGRDSDMNQFIGHLTTQVAELAYNHGRSIEHVVGCFVNEYARGAWEAARLRALEPSLN